MSDEQQCAWRKFAALLNVVPAALDSQLQRDAGLTHFGYWVLAMLSEAPGHALRMSDLAAHSNASPSRVSHVVSRLEKQGWVRRRQAANDGRGQIAELSEAGWQKVVETAPGHVERVRSLIFDGLTDEQVRQLDELCSAMLERIDPEGKLYTVPPSADAAAQQRQPAAR